MATQPRIARRHLPVVLLVLSALLASALPLGPKGPKSAVAASAPTITTFQFTSMTPTEARRYFTTDDISYLVGSVAAGNAQAGIFTYDTATRAVTLLDASAATAQGAINTRQTLNLAAGALAVSPGVEYCSALVLTDATGTMQRMTGTAILLALDDMAFTRTLSPLATSSAVGSSSTASLFWHALVRA